MKTIRMNQMQFLRTLAFLNIYMLHAGHWDIFGYPSWYGAISAVSFFFMLSGFLTGFHFRSEQAQFGPKEYGRYMRRKIEKFYPLYFMTTLCSVLISSIPQDFASGNPVLLISPLVQLARNLLCIQSWFPDGFLSYNGPCWFSSSLLFLTALNLPFFILLRKAEQGKQKKFILSSLLLFFVLGTYLYSYLTRDGFLQYLHYILPLSRIGIYLGSMVLGLWMRPFIAPLQEKARHRLLFTSFEVFALAFWFSSLYFPVPTWMGWNAAWFLPNALVLIAFSFGNGFLSKVFSCKPLVRIGDVTFECYLIHSLIIPVYSKFNKFDTSYTLGCLFSLSFCLLLTYALALFIRRQRAPRT